MQKNFGFTLIELLVVVLIIGILAAVAVPQYQKAVGKARLSNFVLQAFALRNALKMYRLANGQSAQKLSDLDLWTSITKEDQLTNQVAYLGKQRFGDVSGYYIRTGVSLPGNQNFTCDFEWNGTSGFCYTYSSAGASLAESMGWEAASGGSFPYYIGKKSDWK